MREKYRTKRTHSALGLRLSRLVGIENRERYRWVAENVGLFGGLPGWSFIAEEGYIAVVAIDLLLEPTVNDDAIFRTAFV